MKTTRQGVRDLNTQSIVLVEVATNITHQPSKYFLDRARCGVSLKKHEAYQPIEPQPITCIPCMCLDPEPF